MANALFKYDPEGGSLTWRIGTNSFNQGEEVGTEVGADGYSKYKSVCVFGEKYKVHRIVWLMQTGAWPDKYIDHIDGDGLNNRWANLREATPSQNSMNQKVRSDCASGVKGVSYDKRRNMWYAYIDLDGKRNHLGRHETLEEAAAVRQAAEKKYHGEFVRKD